MLLRERRVLPVTPRAVWQVVGDPALMSLWNPKCIRCDALDSAPQFGSCYNTVFRSGSRERECRCKIIAFSPESRIRLQYSFLSGEVVKETFELRKIASGTELTQSVDVAPPNTPWLFQALIWLIHRIGYSAGRSSLDGIAALVSADKSS